LQTFTNTDLLENIRLRALLPESQNLYTDARLLMLANDELQTVIFPMMMSIKGDYFVALDTQTMTSSLTYPIPGDAVGIRPPFLPKPTCSTPLPWSGARR